MLINLFYFFLNIINFIWILYIYIKLAISDSSPIHDYYNDIVLSNNNYYNGMNISNLYKCIIHLKIELKFIIFIL